MDKSSKSLNSRQALRPYMGKSNSSNNQRSNSMNPNNQASKASADNRSRQLNTEDSE